LPAIHSSTIPEALAQLRHAGLIEVRRSGRSLIHKADYTQMDGLMTFLTDNCCGRKKSKVDADRPKFHAKR
jgi:hypothetical protein